MSAGSTGRSAGTAPIGSLAPDDPASFDPAAGEGHGVAKRPVVATAGGVDARRATEFGQVADQRRIEHAPLRQVFEQGRVRLVVHRADDVAHSLDRRERLRAVDVPGDLVEDGQERVDRHEPHAALDQPAGEQAALAEPGHAVSLAGDGRFLGQVERVASLRAGHEPERRLEVAVQERGVLGGFKGRDRVVDELADLAPAVESNRCRSPWEEAGRAPGSRASKDRR